MLTSYIGFEFEGEELANEFQALSDEQQDTLRLKVQDLIIKYWNDSGKTTQKSLEEVKMINKTLAQVDAEAEADAEHCYGGCSGFNGFRGGCGYGPYGLGFGSYHRFGRCGGCFAQADTESGVSTEAGTEADAEHCYGGCSGFNGFRGGCGYGPYGLGFGSYRRFGHCGGCFAQLS